LIPAALGVRAHSGWAALVAVAGDPASPGVVLRERVDMTEPRLAGCQRPYHTAENLEIRDARTLLKRFTDSARRKAEGATSRLLAELREGGFRPVGLGILQASGRLPRSLESILASHALIHAADGEHFRDALARAGEGAGLAVVRIPERELLERAVSTLRRGPEDLQAQAAALGKPLGPPWTADQKLATILAWMLLSDTARA
jgi:hypothetical protein